MLLMKLVGVRSCYDEGKRTAETLAMDYHREAEVEVRIARIFNTYGPRMCIDDGRVALRKEPLTVYGDGKQTRSFQFVSDLISPANFITETTEAKRPANNYMYAKAATPPKKSKLELRPSCPPLKIYVHICMVHLLIFFTSIINYFPLINGFLKLKTLPAAATTKTKGDLKFLQLISSQAKAQIPMQRDQVILKYGIWTVVIQYLRLVMFPCLRTWC
ncbi:hypothetical protein L6452_30671 [Arctium lappa]|uniref:Uncharacterized protein n=1 Tax=Arctium lappa TaxID=4217 RepID=A0ACB8ZJZ8_ARCLA|nr:hypothetical protein L6452_30671 [Arctium lappa]